MQPAYYGHLSGVNADIEQWREFNKSTRPGAELDKHTITVDQTTQKIKNTTKGLFDGLLGRRTDFSEVATWVNSKLINSRLKILSLVKDAYNSNDPVFQKQSLELIAQLNQELILAKNTLYMMEKKVPDGTLKERLNALAEKAGQVVHTEYKEARLRLGEQVQFNANKAFFSEELRPTEHASPLLQQEGISSNPPTASRPYWSYEKDETATSTDFLKYIMEKTNEELQAKQKIPAQFITDLHRIRSIVLNNEIISSLGQANSQNPEAIFNKVVEACGGSEIVAFRLCAMITQTVFKELWVTASLRAVPPTSEEDMKYGPRWGLSTKGGTMFQIAIDSSNVIFTVKTDYFIQDVQEKMLNPGAVMVKKVFTIPLAQLNNPKLDANPLESVTVKDSWSSVLATDAVAEQEIQKF